jgi:hypothetical protein
MTDQNNAVSIARLETEVSYLKTSLTDLKATNAQQSAKLDSIIATMAEARGGWRTLLLIGGAAGAIGGLLGKFLPHFGGA